MNIYSSDNSSFALSKSSFEANLYSYKYDSDRKLVADADKLKGFEDEIKWIGNFQHYKNKIYLVIGGSDIYELEENNKIKRILQNLKMETRRIL